MLGRYEEALRCFDAVIRLLPNHAGAWYNKAGIEALLGHKDKALTLLEKAIKLNPAVKRDAKKSGFFEGMKNDARFRMLVKD